MNKTSFTRQELYELVWKEPVSVIAKKINFPATAIRDACNKFLIPLPPNGHWVKKQFGKEGAQIQLPLEYKGEEMVHFEEKNATIERGIKESITRSQQSKILDPLVIAARDFLRSKDRRVYEGMVSTAIGMLDISVSPGKVERALDFMDIFIKAVKARGHIVSFKEKETKVTFMEVDIAIAFRERSQRTKGDNDWTKYVPTGNCYFRLDTFRGHEWRDGSKKTLEEQIPQIIQKMENIAIDLNVGRERHRREKEARMALRRDAQLVQERKQIELDAFKNLLSDAKRWQQAEIMKRYIAALENSQQTVMVDKENWLTWARQKIDWYDPFVEAADDLLQDVDRNTLTFIKTNT